MSLKSNRYNNAGFVHPLPDVFPLMSSEQDISTVWSNAMRYRLVVRRNQHSTLSWTTVKVKAVKLIQPDYNFLYSMKLVYNIHCAYKSLIPLSEIPPPIHSAADWFPLAMIDGSLRSSKQTRVSVCLVCVRSVSGLRPVCVLLRACTVFALRPPSVHTEWGRRAFCVHSVLTLRSLGVNDAFTLRSLWFFRKWATLNATFTLSADWVHARWNHSSALYCSVQWLVLTIEL